MTDSNAYIVNDKKTDSFKPMSMDHRLFVPGRFVLGYFRVDGTDFKFDDGRFMYEDSPEVLAQYQRFFDEGHLVVAQSLQLPESVLESIAQKGKVYIDAKKQISESVQSVDQHLV